MENCVSAPDPFAFDTKLVPDVVDVAAFQQAGYGVAVYGDTVLQGGPGIGIGRVFAHFKDTGVWTNYGYFEPVDGSSGDLFGLDVAISGSRIVIGATANSGIGAAYVATGDPSWAIDDKLTPSDGASGDSFGDNVAIDGDYLVVGAPGNDSSQGAAYVFHWNGSAWVEQAKIVASDGVAGASFGNSVGISGDYIIAGAYQDSDGATYDGAAYVFHRSGITWTEQAKLTQNDPDNPGTDPREFAGSVAISGDYIMVSAEADNANAGAVYVFLRSGAAWDFTQKITGSATALDSFFGGYGRGVAMSGSTAVIASVGEEAAYVFILSAGVWAEQSRLEAPVPVGGDSFGASVAVQGNLAVIGTLGDDDNGSNTGASYLFSR